MLAGTPGKKVNKTVGVDSPLSIAVKLSAASEFEKFYETLEYQNVETVLVKAQKRIQLALSCMPVNGADGYDEKHQDTYAQVQIIFFKCKAYRRKYNA